MTGTLLKFLTLSVALAICGTAQAQRLVSINGTMLNAAQVHQLELMACTGIPDGNYWLDLNSGAWGYAGNALRMGYLGDACNQTRRRPSLSERGQLYRPGEILGGR
ncbi:MAG: hypothetical protein HKN42_15515 [Granulosicoccus sp.]|nr:hypothetical protein [Granulosicoccus sp.]